MIPKALFIFVILTAPLFSVACKCEDKSVEQKFAEAENIYFVRIVDAVLLEGDDSLVNTGSRMVEAHYEVKESFKGAVQEVGRVFVSEYNKGNCSLGLIVSEYYVLFINKHHFVNTCGGSGKYEGPDSLEVLRKLKEEAKS